MTEASQSQVKITVVGTGGAGGNAVARMIRSGIRGAEMVALNTDVQALSQLTSARTFAIGPNTTGGMGSGGRPETGRKAMKESMEEVSELLDGSDMVFVTAGMGGGTGTGAAPLAADLARRMGALTVGVVTLPFSFEGPRRRATALKGMKHLRGKVDTLIAIENDRLLAALDGQLQLENAFELADEVLKQGVQGISDLVTVPGLINVDFADLKAVIRSGGSSYMAVGTGRGNMAAAEATELALSNPLFDAPIDGAQGIILNVTGGADLTLAQVHQAADLVRNASRSEADLLLGVVQDRKMEQRVRITLVATGLRPGLGSDNAFQEESDAAADPGTGLLEAVVKANGNGHNLDDPARATTLV